MSSLTDKNQGHQNPGQNQQGQTQGKPISQDPGQQDQGQDVPDPKRQPAGQERKT